MYNVTDVAKSRIPADADGNLIPTVVHYSDRSSWGFNIIFEDTYSITEELLLGLKFLSQPYDNGDINSGILVKFGVKI